MPAIGFIGLGNMGFPMAARLLQTGHEVVAFDNAAAALDAAVQLGARPAQSPKDVGDQAETVLASLPTPQVSLTVAAGADGVLHGARVRRYLDLSTIGSAVAQQISLILASRTIAALDCPVSGGIRGAVSGSLAIMVSGPRLEFDAVSDVLGALGNPIFVAETPGAAQTMKLVNNLMAAATLAVTAEVMVMGVKAGLDAHVMIDVLNAGSGATHASRDKFPRAVLSRTFDYGFATGLMAKDVRLYLSEAAALGVPTEIAETVAALWERTVVDEGSSSDFTAIVKPLERAAGVQVRG